MQAGAWVQRCQPAGAGSADTIDEMEMRPPAWADLAQAGQAERSTQQGRRFAQLTGDEVRRLIVRPIVVGQRVVLERFTASELDELAGDRGGELLDLERQAEMILADSIVADENRVSNFGVCLRT